MHDDESSYKRERKEYVRSELRLYKSYIQQPVFLHFVMIIS